VFLEMEAESGKYRRPQALLVDLFSALKRRTLKRRASELNVRLRESEQSGDVETAARLASEIAKLKKEMSALSAED